MKYVLHPAAFEDLTDAASYYVAHGSEAVGQAFISEFERVTRLLMDNPELGMKTVAKARRFAMRRFPFFVVYRIFPDRFFVIAIAHQRRRPGFWRNRVLS